MFASTRQLQMLVLLASLVASRAADISDSVAQAFDHDDECAAGDSCALNAIQLRGFSTATGGDAAAADSDVDGSDSDVSSLVSSETHKSAANRTAKLSTTTECIGQTGWDTNFAAHCYECGFRNLANAYRSGRCMADKQGVSLQCGSCIGQLIHCGTKCLHECCYGRCYTGQSCLACQETTCNTDFFGCAGVYPPTPTSTASVEVVGVKIPAGIDEQNGMPIQLDEDADETKGISLTVGDILEAAAAGKASDAPSSEGALVAAGSACVGQAGWDTNFAAHSYYCGFRNMANAYLSGHCMADKQGVSLQCGSCIGQLIHCGTKCLHECCFGHCFTEQSCFACQAKNCNQAFFDCAGAYPPNPTSAASAEDIGVQVPVIAAAEESTPLDLDEDADETKGIELVVGDLLKASESDKAAGVVFSDDHWKAAAAAAVAAVDAANRTIELLSAAACVDQAGWDTNFATHCYQCGFYNMANAYRSGRCMAEKQGVSLQCGSCIGQLINCGTTCMHECCFGHCMSRPSCTACQEKNCNQAFFECSGVRPNSATSVEDVIVEVPAIAAGEDASSVEDTLPVMALDQTEEAEDIATRAGGSEASMNVAADDASSDAVMVTGANRTTELSSEACVGQAGWDTNFAARCYGCGFWNLAKADLSGRCMADKQGVSSQCGSCIGKLINCGTKCAHECCFGHCFSRPSCLSCQETTCNQDFFDCAGVNPPQP